MSARHVDDFISDRKSDNYASFVLNWFRAPATDHARYSKFMANFQLFGTFQGKRYRITGASRLGDVWLAKDFTCDYGYDLRVDVDDITDWGNKP